MRNVENFFLSFNSTTIMTIYRLKVLDYNILKIWVIII